MFLAILLFFIPAIILVIDFLKFLLTFKRLFGRQLMITVELISIVSLAGFFLVSSWGTELNCCDRDFGGTIFNPDHSLSWYVWIIVCLCALIFSLLREKMLPPIIELGINILLLFGLFLNIVLFIHEDPLVWGVGNLPITLIFVIHLAINHRRIINDVHEDKYSNSDLVTHFAWTVLRLPPLMKYPILLIMVIPFIVIVSGILLLFGQKPDSMIRALTETYYNGFSTWNHKCYNVDCGGHYLCSVAANGDEEVVHPIRYGERNGALIICNRQLLVSNAFEQVIEERLPSFHKKIRIQYDKVGDQIHDNYEIYEKKWVSNLVYYIMKPAEWCFTLFLYMTVRDPETRIAKQYLPKDINRARNL